MQEIKAITGKMSRSTHLVHFTLLSFPSFLPLSDCHDVDQWMGPNI